MTTPYTTVERFKTQGLGTDLTNVEDVELFRHIVAASAAVDAYCAVPRLPSAHSFAGGIITNEQKRWTIGSDTINGTRRFYPWHRPVRTVTSFRIRLTNTITVSVGPDDIFINQSEGYVELVSLAAVSFGVYPIGVVPNLGLATPTAELSYTYGWSFPVVGEPLFATDGYTYQASNGFWEEDSETVYVDGVATTTGFTVDRTEGTIVFSALEPGPVSVDYSYTLPQEIARATNEIVADRLSERSLVAKGLGGLAGIRMAEIELRRSLRGTTVEAALQNTIPDSAALLLEGYRFRSVA